MPEPATRLRWRPWLRALHRDLGYLAVGLTFVYALSGLAVNHIEDWDPNFDNYEVTHQVAGPFPAGDREVAEHVLRALSLGEAPKDVYRVDGGINPSALAQLAPYPGQPVRVQIRNRATKKAVSLTSTRLSVTKDISYNNVGKTTKVNWYRFTVWPNVPVRPAQADLRLITSVKGRSVVTAWVPLG